jgi:hypothetical protein
LNWQTSLSGSNEPKPLFARFANPCEAWHNALKVGIDIARLGAAYCYPSDFLVHHDVTAALSQKWSLGPAE